MTSQPPDLPQPRTHAEQEDLRTARFYFRSMLQSDAHTDLVPQVGRWNDACLALHAVHKIDRLDNARRWRPCWEDSNALLQHDFLLRTWVELGLQQ